MILRTDEGSKFLVLSENERAKFSNGGLPGDQLGKVAVLGFKPCDTAAQLVKLSFQPIRSGLLCFRFALPDFRRLVIDRRADANVSGGQGAECGQCAKRPTGRVDKRHGGTFR